MTKKEIQERDNIIALHMYGYAGSRFNTDKTSCIGQLRNCHAKVYANDEFYYLISYNTTVAVIERNRPVAYDVLRHVYGYTATSAYHIRKFIEDYTKGFNQGDPIVYTYR